MTAPKMRFQNCVPMYPKSSGHTNQAAKSLSALSTSQSTATNLDKGRQLTLPFPFSPLPAGPLHTHSPKWRRKTTHKPF